jgi:hypothetical protein
MSNTPRRLSTHDGASMSNDTTAESIAQTRDDIAQHERLIAVYETMTL